MTDESPDAERDPSDDRSMTALAQRLESVLNDDLGETVVGIASYEDGEHVVTYRDEVASSQYTDSGIRAIMKNV